jgi:hypothetical protein
VIIPFHIRSTSMPFNIALSYSLNIMCVLVILHIVVFIVVLRHEYTCKKDTNYFFHCCIHVFFT